MKLFTIYTEKRSNLAVLTGGRFDGFTLVETVGYWRGIREDSTKIEIIADAASWDTVLELAEDIRRTNDQQAVFVTEQAVNAELVTGRQAAITAQPIVP